MKSLQGKNAIVTGARTGIGKAIVNRFANEGVNVWAVVHREDVAWLHEMEVLSKQNNVWIHPVYIDLSSEEEIKEGVHGIIKEKLPIDILVNAAGIVSENRLIQMTHLQTMRDVMQVNFFAPIQISQLVSRVMCRQKSGSIINIASVAAYEVDLAQLEYVASKAALIASTRKMAKEWGASNVRVNAIAPGLIDTKMLSNMDFELMKSIINRTALKRVGMINEIADLCTFLATDNYITAQTYRIDGGL